MNSSEIYAAMDLPQSCLLGKRVFKKLFHENAKLTAADKRALSQDVSAILWQYTLKKMTVPILEYADDECEYVEISILEVQLESKKNASRIGEIVHRAIPYPVIILFCFDNACALSSASKRLSRAEGNAIVAEDFLFTDWFEDENRNQHESAFLASLGFSKLPKGNFWVLYQAYEARILGLIASKISDNFKVGNGESNRERYAKLETCKRLQREIVELKSAIHSEPVFARQVEMNTSLKQLEKRLKEEAQQL